MADVKSVSELSKGDEILLGDTAFLTRLDKAIGWARKFSIFPYPFATACCAMEYMSLSMTPYDIDRFGALLPRFTPRQADLLMVIGTVSVRQGPILRRVFDQMAEPKWVMAFGACASTGGFYDNYATLPGIDRIVPVDVYVPGCPPRPESVLDALMALQRKIQGQKQKLMRARHQASGRRSNAPLITSYIQMERILTRWLDIPDLRKLEVYEAHGGYQALRKALFDMTPEQIINEVKNSNLRGRGGAAFPTGTKWSFIPKESKKPVYVCCNADEAEPGTFANRYQLENDPHGIIEGILICCRAVGSHHLLRLFARRVHGAEAHPRCGDRRGARARLVGKNIMGSGFDVEIWTHRGAGAYICGEETGLLESLEGKRGVSAQPAAVSRRSRARSDVADGGQQCRDAARTCRTSSRAAPIGIRASVPRRARARNCSASRVTSSCPASMSCRWAFR